MCHFLDSPGAIDLDRLRDYLNAATGWDMSIFEMLKVAERTITMPRLFNLREGFTAADDTLPARMFEPLRNGALAGRALDPAEFAQALDLYYQMAGWNEHGVPTPGKLAELGLTWVSKTEAASRP
jgi:aldehyde:ferredoxin oxidoreductase